MYRIVFWNLCLFHQYIKKNHEIYSKFPSEYEALFSLITFEGINVLAIFNVLHININLQENEIKYWLINIGIFIFNYFFLVRNEQVKKYIKKTEGMNKRRLLLGKYISLIYIFLTICFICISNEI